MKYPARISPERGGYSVTFRDIPQATALADTQEEAYTKAMGILLTTMNQHANSGVKMPEASIQEPGEVVVVLPAASRAKLVLHEEMHRQKVDRMELADRMGVSRQKVDRLMDMTHQSKINTIEEALSFLGRDLSITLVSEKITMDEMVSVPAKPLLRLLQALNGPDHIFRELQATRGLDKLGLNMGEPNPIEALTNYWNALVDSNKKKE